MRSIFAGPGTGMCEAVHRGRRKFPTISSDRGGALLRTEEALRSDPGQAMHEGDQIGLATPVFEKMLLRCGFAVNLRDREPGRSTSNLPRAQTRRGVKVLTDSTS
jgi:hypothetical protein